MKTTRCRTWFLVVFLAVFATSARAQAQGDTVTIGASEFQRMVYSAHLLTQVAEKPELAAMLQVLLDLNRRNPQAEPGLLAGVLREATARYRSNAPSYIRVRGSPDAVLASYLDALREVSARTNLVLANLSLLNALITRAPAPSFEPQADLLHSGSQDLLGAEGGLVQRQALLDACVGRAWENAGFFAAMDALLVPETLVSLGHGPVEIIGHTNSPLRANTTMQLLLALSVSSGNGSVTVSSNQLMALFSGETQTFWDTIHTNLAVQAEINRRQPDLLAYLTNQPAIDANAQWLTAVTQGQARRIASATAAVLVQSKLMKARQPLIKLPGQMQGVLEGLHKVTDGLAAFGDKDITKLGKAAACGNVLAGGLQLFNVFLGGESAEEEIAREVGNIKILLGDLVTNINYRFDRVDQSLTTIFETLNERFDQVEITLDAHGRQIAHLNGDVDQIRLSLLDLQTDLFRLERNLATFHALDWRFDLLEDMNLALGFEARVGIPMAYDQFSPNYGGMENVFYTYAFYRAASETLSRYTTLPFGDEYFYSQLSPGGATNVYAEVLNYIKKCLRQRLGLAGFPEQPFLANPQDWAAGAGAWLQLAVENPGHFRRYERDLGFPSRLDGIISKGRELTNFISRLSFASGTNVNWPLYDALEAFYVGKLTNFTGHVRALEQQYATEHYIPTLERWRAWALALPRVTVDSSELLESHIESPVIPTELIGTPASPGIVAIGGVSGRSHGLALQTGGTVVAWGNNDYGQSTVPANLANAIAVAAGAQHSLALRADKTVIAWGASYCGPGGTPPMVSNVVAIGVGKDHNLAVRADGRVVGWGYNYYGQATGVPTPGSPYCSTGLVQVAGEVVTNAVAAAGGYYYSLVLKADGTIVLAGGAYGETNVPAGLSNIVSIAAGSFHCLALRSNGTVVAWGEYSAGQTNVPSGLSNVVAVAAGSHHSLALRRDGTVVAWGWGDDGQTNVPAGLSNVVAIAADQYNSLALRRDGTLVVWGYNDWYWQGPLPVPPGLTDVVAADGGSTHILALKADGTVVAWSRPHASYEEFGQTNVPAGLSNVAAIAAGDYHNLALRSNGTVVAWGTGYWNYGQANVPANLSNVVAITAGAESSAALKSDGTIVWWGRAGLDPPSDLTNVLAISAGKYFNLALTAGGGVRAWGDNSWGQRNVPANATNVVGISAGVVHALALRADGTVVSWGGNDSGSTNVPAGLSNVVAIAAGDSLGVALKADGTAVAWGWGGDGRTNTPLEATNIVAIGTGYAFSLYVNAKPGNTNSQPTLGLVRGATPARARNHLWAFNDLVRTNLSFDLRDEAIELSGGKALFQAVTELAMPYTLERDDVLHGFLYGSEALAGLDAVYQFLDAEDAKRLAMADAVPRELIEVTILRYLRFRERLDARLNDLAAGGQPEIPRLVGHTLRSLQLLRDAWESVPPPALEIGRQGNAIGLFLYGEPYARYTLLCRENLNVTGWTTTTITNLHSEVFTTPPMSGPQRFYRGRLNSLP